MSMLELEERLKTNFMKIVELKETNQKIFATLQSRITMIKQSYREFIHEYKESIFIFTLDSFHFQGKLIDLEYNEMTRIYLAILNKMYCEYYKLYRIVIDYVKQNIQDEKLLNLIKATDQYPVYKDLEPYKEYDFQHTKELHESILIILSGMNGYLMNKEHELVIYQGKKKIGFNIDNFVNTFNFNNTMMKEKIQLFITYIEFFHKMHTKYLSRFSTKIQLMLSQVNHDIHFDEDYAGGESPREKKNREKKSKQVMKTIQAELNMDRENMTEKERRIMKEVKSSIFSVASFDDTSDTSTSSTLTIQGKKPEEDVLVYTVGMNEFDSELSDPAVPYSPDTPTIHSSMPTPTIHSSMPIPTIHSSMSTPTIHSSMSTPTNDCDAHGEERGEPIEDIQECLTEESENIHLVLDQESTDEQQQESTEEQEKESTEEQQQESTEEQQQESTEEQQQESTEEQEKESTEEQQQESPVGEIISKEESLSERQLVDLQMQIQFSDIYISTDDALLEPQEPEKSDFINL